MGFWRCISKGFAVLVFAGAAMTVPSVLLKHPSETDPVDRGKDSLLRCALDMTDSPNGPKGLDAGLNYYLLKKFGDETKVPTDIRLASKDENFRDSLLSGKVDIVATSLADSIEYDDALVFSIPVNDNTAWLIRKEGSRRLLMEINSWITSTRRSRMYNRVVASYRRKGGGTQISPYDSIIKVHAKTFGWDWRLLSAIIYHESRFSISSESRHGAVGLMQIIPLNHTVDSLLDPSYNVWVGARYLRRLENMFTPFAADSLESLKFAIAAFNAGEGRIIDCIRYADNANFDSSRWDHIVELIPEMEEFHGKETIAYVDSVLSTYYAYLRNYN